MHDAGLATSSVATGFPNKGPTHRYSSLSVGANPTLSRNHQEEENDYSGESIFFSVSLRTKRGLKENKQKEEENSIY